MGCRGVQIGVKGTERLGLGQGNHTRVRCRRKVGVRGRGRGVRVRIADMVRDKIRFVDRIL